VTVPVEHSWELEGLLPTGRKTSPKVVAELSHGMAAGTMRLDHVFSGLKFDNHRCATTVHDPQSKRTMTQTFDDQFVALCRLQSASSRSRVHGTLHDHSDPFTLAKKRSKQTFGSWRRARHFALVLKSASIDSSAHSVNSGAKQNCESLEYRHDLLSWSSVRSLCPAGWKVSGFAFCCAL